MAGFLQLDVSGGKDEGEKDGNGTKRMLGQHIWEYMETTYPLDMKI